LPKAVMAGLEVMEVMVKRVLVEHGKFYAAVFL
jgi:hypothetical protein